MMIMRTGSGGDGALWACNVLNESYFFLKKFNDKNKSFVKCIMNVEAVRKSSTYFLPVLSALKFVNKKCTHKLASGKREG